MILISQDGFKAFNMAYIKSYFMYEDKLGKLPNQSATDEKHEYIIWIDPHPYWENQDFYSVGKFEKLKDAQKVFSKLTSIPDPSAKGVIKITDNGVEFFFKNYWTGETEKYVDNQE